MRLEEEPYREHYKIEKQNKELHPSEFLKQLPQTASCKVECQRKKVRENINTEPSRENAKKNSSKETEIASSNFFSICGLRSAHSCGFAQQLASGKHRKHKDGSLKNSGLGFTSAELWCGLHHWSMLSSMRLAQLVMLLPASTLMMPGKGLLWFQVNKTRHSCLMLYSRAPPRVPFPKL